MSTMARAFWEEIYKRFEPEEPAVDQKWRAARPNSPRSAISRGLNRPFAAAGKRYLVVGTVGTGKSTELLAIADEQCQKRMVIFLDLHRHFADSVRDASALHHVQPWEVLLLIGVAVYRAANELFGHEWTNQNVAAINKAMQAFANSKAEGNAPTVDIAQLAGSMAILAGGAAAVIPGATVVGAGLMVIGTAVKSGRWNFTLGRREERANDQDPRVKDLLNAVNLLIGTLQGAYQPLLLVVDGLDRIAEKETVRGLFIESTLLADLVCPIIVASPPSLRTDGMANQVRHFEPQVLANAPVLDHNDPQKHGSGIHFFLELYRLRVADLEGAQIPEPLLRRLAYYSGGRGRDFVKLVRMTAEWAWDKDVAVVTEAEVDRSIDDLRRIRELGLNKGDIELLRQVAADPEHRLPDNDRVDPLLNQVCLLPYPNESEWYFPHPLLTLTLVPFPPG